MKRRRTEEIMGWICVPIFVVVGYYGWSAFQQVQSERTQNSREQVVTPAATAVIRK